MWNMEDTNFQQNIETSKLENDEPFSFNETQFNIAFGLFPNTMDFTDYHHTNSDNYVEFHVSLIKAGFVDGNIQKEMIPLETHICNSSDVFFETPNEFKAATAFIKPQMNCLDSPQNITIWGNLRNTLLQALMVRVIPCTGKDTCKSESEINDFIDRIGHLTILHNNQIYKPNDYTDNVINKQLIMDYLPINSHSNLIQSYRLQKQTLESEESFIGFGINPRIETFYPLKKSTESNDSDFPDSFGGFSIEVSPDVVNNNRSIFSVLDFLGDIGGLLSILVDCGRILMYVPVFLCGCGIKKYIAESLFKQ